MIKLTLKAFGLTICVYLCGVKLPMAKSESTIWARHALTDNGWQSNVCVRIDSNGWINSVTSNQTPTVNARVGILLPAVANLHSHFFQRAFAGLTETRGPDPNDSFWSWRKLMYSFLQQLTPDDIESIAAFAQMQMLESGYASVGEFHYLHHQPNGSRYTECAEMCERIIAAAVKTGIGLTLLPVLYEQGGCDGRALAGGQKRFGNSIDEFSKLYADASSMISKQSDHYSIGIAPHSLRAVSQDSLKAVQELGGVKPFHIHISEQQAEVEEVLATLKARPVEWLLDNHEINDTWCLIHATHMRNNETEKLAKTGATVGLCPITESNLGDGIFNGSLFQQHGGQWGIGTDSNVRISLSEELRTLEYSQRLNECGRAIYADQNRSCGRVLFDNATTGGAKSLQRQSGSISKGKLADLLALDLTATNFVAVEKDQWLDAWIFADSDSLITDVWSAGVAVVSNGKHIHHANITERYRNTISSLVSAL